eukprot:gb/GECH01009545.1/.p1 GENE.gb/GECH01009545.1/~~gb/GECH01009545.1/.p1  ORF type:complete len:835 (+),score=173.40 gb/GECH01009545.1/:1-2505(+)
MATSLQKQLNVIRQSRGIESTSKRLGTDSAKASFFFNTSDAALLTADDLYGLAIEGLDELSEFDGRFVDFKNNLFSIGTKDLHRELLTQEENDKLTIPIDNFFRLLSPYFLLQPAHKCIEYMVRRYKVHEFNVDAVMACVLPYHETTLFARLVQILNVSTTRWRFLSIIQDNGVPLPRETLVAKASRDMGLTSFICDMAQRGLQENTASKTLLGFFGIFVSELFSSAPSLSDRLIKTVFPYLFSALKPIPVVVDEISNNSKEDDNTQVSYENKDTGEEVHEYRSAAFMAFTIAFSRVALSRDFLDEAVHLIIDVMTRRTSAMRVRRNLFTHALLCLCFMCQSQSVKQLEPKYAEALFKHSHFLPALLSISKTYDIKSFLKAAFPSLIAKTVENFDEYEEIADYFLKEMPLEPVVKSGAKQLFNLFLEKDKEKQQKSITNIMKIIDARYPEPLDDAIDEALDEAINEEERQKILSFVQIVFKGTGHERLEDTGVSLFMALSHQQARIRSMAMKRLSSIDIQSQENYKGLRRSLEIVFKRLALGAEDNNPDLLNMIQDLLKFPNILQLILPDQLFSLLSNMIKHFNQVEMQSEKKGDIISVLVVFLTEKFSHEYSEYTSEIFPIVLQFLFIQPNSKRPNCVKSILKAAKTLNHPLLQFVKGTAPPSKNDQSNIKSVAKYNEDIAKQIGTNLVHHTDEYLASFLKMLKFHPTWCPAAHVLLHSIQNEKFDYQEKLRVCSKLVKHTHLSSRISLTDLLNQFGRLMIITTMLIMYTQKYYVLLKNWISNNLMYSTGSTHVKNIMTNLKKIILIESCPCQFYNVLEPKFFRLKIQNQLNL